MFDWLLNIIDHVTNFLDVMVSSTGDMLSQLNDLTSQLNNAANNTNFVVTKTLGAVRFIVGDALYTAFYISIVLGLLYTIVILVQAVLDYINKAKANIISSWFSGLPTG